MNDRSFTILKVIGFFLVIAAIFGGALLLCVIVGNGIKMTFGLREHGLLTMGPGLVAGGLFISYAGPIILNACKPRRSTAQSTPGNGKELG